jgi:H+/Cl- antiporter ClcA
MYSYNASSPSAISPPAFLSSAARRPLSIIMMALEMDLPFSPILPLRMPFNAVLSATSAPSNSITISLWGLAATTPVSMPTLA